MTFADETAVFLGGAEARALHFGRGHTNGDAVIYFPDLRAVHTGDLFIYGQRLDGTTLSPFWDYGNGGSAAEWPATLTGFARARLRHGDSGTRGDPRQGRTSGPSARSSRRCSTGCAPRSRPGRPGTTSPPASTPPTSTGRSHRYGFQGVYDELTAAE